MSIVKEVALNWARRDIEQRLAFRGGRYTRVNTWLSVLLAVALSLLFYGAIWPLSESVGVMFFRESIASRVIPCAIVFMSSWSVAILFLKSRKLAFQRKSLNHMVVPADHSFVLSRETVNEVIEKIYETVDDPKHFLLFNRIMIALSNLRNLGRVSDVDEILRSQASHDESMVETSYSLIRGFIWAIPVLGFIGTVLGLSTAIGGFGAVLSSTDDISQITASLSGVTSGLSTAFETTLQALVAALSIQLVLTFLKKNEEEFLDSCSEYCVLNIVNRLRIMPYQGNDED